MTDQHSSLVLNKQWETEKAWEKHSEMFDSNYVNSLFNKKGNKSFISATLCITEK